MKDCPEFDPSAPLQFLINAAAGSNNAQAMREVIASVLNAEGRQGELHFCSPAELTSAARASAQTALSTRTAVVAVGEIGRAHV